MNFIDIFINSNISQYWFTECEYSLNPVIDIKRLESVYCLCSINLSNTSEQHLDIIKIWNCSRNPLKDTKQKRKAKFLDIYFKDNLQKLIKFVRSIEDESEIMFAGKQKSSSRANASSKRTSYFGVSKNGPNWQALISINKRKTYVGTFMTEREAGEAFDFYSMLLHGSRALTNFRYSKLQVENLIERFKSTISHNYNFS